ncbi:MAG: DUF362 domain-containing protein [Actinobacteria bacterium]|nr:DUF362 domain-containing protein [Actinomycetota bacterium]
MEKVSAVECHSYDADEVYAAVKTALAAIDFTIPEGITVLIKPNIMSQNRPEQNTITHPALIDALCRILKERGCKILIGESISFYEMGLTRKAFEVSGIEEVANKYGASLIAFEEVPLVRKDKDAAGRPLVGVNELYLPEILFQVDMIINACKLKSHGSLHLSGAVKNMFGCLPGGYKAKMHILTRNDYELSEVFVDVEQTVNPTLSIMDAIESLERGPTALGKAVKTDRILASTNAAALDVAASRMIGYKLEKSPILVQALKRGAIRSFDDVEIIGDLGFVQFEEPKKPDPDDVVKDSIFVTDTYVNLEIDDARCTKCGACIKACPIGGIAETGGTHAIDKEACISCYYCMHVCPEAAIVTKPSGIFRVISALRKITGV